MLYSYRIEQAIRAASVLHRNHFRKGVAPYPYISHLFAVSCIVADYTVDEDIIIASILHDSLEGTGYTAQELESDFGSRVRMIVELLTEYPPLDTTYTWSERKDAYIANLAEAPEEVLLVAAADAIHNLRSIVEEYQQNVAGYETDFNGSLTERALFYDTKGQMLRERLASPIVAEYDHVLNEYKRFLFADTDYSSYDNPENK